MSAGLAWTQLGLGWAFALFGVWLLTVSDTLFARLAAGQPLLAARPASPWSGVARALIKESRRIDGADHRLWRATPLMLVFVGGAMLAFGPAAANTTAEVPAALLAPLLGLTLAGLMQFIAGWAVNSAYALIGACRALGLLVACLVPLTLSIAALAVTAGSLELAEVVATQQLGLWNVVLQPIGFALYLLIATVLSGWGPVKGPSSHDLAGGVELEMTGTSYLLWRLGRYLVLLGAATLAVPLFLGGGQGPWLPAPFWFGLKSLLVGMVMLAAHHILPQLPLERFLRGAWLILIPLAALNFTWALLCVLYGPALAVGAPDGLFR